MSNINIGDELETLFKEWKDRLGTHFTKDGVMYRNGKTNEQVEQEWLASPIRVAFLLKDQNQGKYGTWDEDINLWLKDVDWGDANADKWNASAKANRNIENRFLKNIAYILWGLAKTDSNVVRCFSETKEHHNEVIAFFNSQPFALIECKKEPGVSYLDTKKLCNHLATYGDLLKKELDILHPNIIVCCGGSSEIFNFITKTYYKDKDPIPFGGEYVLDGTDYGFKTQLYYYPDDNVIVIDSFHPKDRKGDWLIFDRVLSPFRSFMNSEYASNFLKV
jgi:hypothetical protein